MVKARKFRCVASYMLVVFLVLVASFGMFKISYALTDEQLDEFAQNNILFYDPGASNNLCKGVSYNSQVTWTDLNPLMSDGYEATGERFKLIVETYGPFAMELQRYYGIPWEMPFVMMIFESEVGYGSSGPNAENKEVGDYNMMGLMYSSALGDDHYDDSLRAPKADQTEATSYYQSISRMLLGWTLYHVRSDHGEGYKQGLEKLDKDSYDDNLLEALGLIMQSYRASSDNYHEKLYDVMRGKDIGFEGLSEDEKTAIKHYADALASVIKSKGWKNSAELAKSLNIPAGGLVTTDDFRIENGWGGWDDIRENAWNAYGLLGLPEESASRLGTNGTGCGTRLRGSCFELKDVSDGGCTKDDFTFFNQGGPTWRSIKYACENIQDAGCGPSAVAMVITALTDSLVTPDMVVEKIVKQEGGYSETGRIQICNGGSYGTVATIAEQYGLKAVHALPSSVEEINKWLDEGKMMTFTVGPYPMRYIDENDQEKIGTVTDKGHFIAIRGRDDGGRWLTFDSGGWSWYGHGEWEGDFRNDRRYNPDDIFAAYLDHKNYSKGMYLISR